MKLIRLNKGILIISFFMPFMTMCSDLVAPKPSRGELSGRNTHIGKSILVLPTEESISAFGVAYLITVKSFEQGFEFNVFDFVFVSLICSIVGFLLTFFQRGASLIFYLSVLNLTGLLVLVGYLMQDGIENFLDVTLWGFWLLLVLSVVDVFLVRKVYNSVGP